ncbi:acylneuraminate cytidylyltransferase family protein [Winogradskyella vincentii]|uniref:Acylneuraminate cytidylyltransferase family protein n=1 Tax=Winogradskyella vincentii TaxID=2877122 RepID=A0ABS7Y1A5_9FLAO|nr:acylneuraminate cytidylyltransferase family protein [Winogradskyella vincentii]MCA0153713.1 acylneuraminate cytidylyltransferase family protein [Winogradskyella vincentii]
MGNSVFIIPARGGSKRLPGKNLIELNALPLIEHSINFAKQNSDITPHIIVTTDNEEIKTFALKKGVQVFDRPEAISKDDSTTVSALKHVLEQSNRKYEVVILLQPTNPLRPKELLKNAFKKFIDSNSDSLMTVSLNEKKLGKIKNGKFIPFTYKMGQRSQDLEPLYFENGLLYISKADLILNDRILGDNNFPYIVEHPYTTVDIDTLDDLKYAEFIVNNYADE